MSSNKPNCFYTHILIVEMGASEGWSLLVKTQCLINNVKFSNSKFKPLTPLPCHLYKTTNNSPPWPRHTQTHSKHAPLHTQNSNTATWAPQGVRSQRNTKCDPRPGSHLTLSINSNPPTLCPPQKHHTHTHTRNKTST